MDASATRYAARVSMQTGRQEIIVDLKGMVGGSAGWRVAGAEGQPNGMRLASPPWCRRRCNPLA